MPRSKELSESMRAAAKEKILSASKSLFLEKGIAATSVKEIAQGAGVSSGLLYHYFKTKEEIFSTLVKEAMAEQAKMGEFLLEGEPAAKLKFFVNTILDAVAENGEYVRVMSMFTSIFIENVEFPGLDDIIEGNERFNKQVVDFIKKGQSEGVFKEGNPVAMAQLLLLIIGGISNIKFDCENRDNMPTQEMLTAFILKEDIS